MTEGSQSAPLIDSWSFSPMLMTPESLEQTYRVRLALEPAALLEPTYRLDPDVAARCREAGTSAARGRHRDRQCRCASRTRRAVP